MLNDWCGQYASPQSSISVDPKIFNLAVEGNINDWCGQYASPQSSISVDPKIFNLAVEGNITIANSQVVIFYEIQPKELQFYCCSALAYYQSSIS